MQILVKLGHHFARLQAPPIAAEFFDPACQHREQREIALNDRLDVRPKHFNGDLTLLERVTKLELNRAEMHLRHAGAGNWRPVEA